MEPVSALMDGELDGSEAGRAIDRVLKDADARLRWDTYHLIGDAFRNEYLLSRSLAASVGVRLAAEPTVLAPKPRRNVVSRLRKYALSATASAAAVAVVGWLALYENPITSNYASLGVARLQYGDGAASPAARPVALDGSVRAYLFAHQEYSPATQIQGVAPYVRTVTEVPTADSR